MKKFILLASLVVLSACGVSSTDGVVSRGKNSGGFLGLAEKANVEVTGEKALAGTNQVVVGAFKVGFAESSKQTRQAGGGLLGSGTGGRAQGNVRLDGVSEDLKKAITEAAYNDFVAQLKSKGFTVVNSSQFFGSKQYSGVKKYDFPYVMDNSGFLSSYGRTTFYQPSAFGAQGIMFMNDIQGVTGGFGFSNGDMSAAEFSKETGIPVVSATYIVDFAAAGGHGGKWSSSASVQVGQSLAVTSGTVKFVKDMTSTFNSGAAAISLGQPIESGQEFGQVVEETSTANRAVQETANVLSVLMGGGTNRAKDFVVHADPSLYKAQSLSVLKLTNEALIGKAASLR
jgi:hypothetical protein